MYNSIYTYIYSHIRINMSIKHTHNIYIYRKFNAYNIICMNIYMSVYICERI